MEHPRLPQVAHHQHQHRGQDHAQKAADLQAHIDGQQSHQGVQAGLVPHKLGLNHPAEDADHPPHRQHGDAPLPVANGHEDDGPGHHHRAGANDGDKVHDAQQHRQQDAIGLFQQKEPHHQDYHDP